MSKHTYWTIYQRLNVYLTSNMSIYLSAELCLRAMDNVGKRNIPCYESAKNTRLVEVVALRSACMIYLYQNLSLGFTKIGTLFNMNHATIIHNVRKAESNYKQRELERFKMLLKQEIELLLRQEFEKNKTPLPKNNWTVLRSKKLRNAIEIGYFNPQINLSNELPNP